jgi:hypothetical protein
MKFVEMQRGVKMKDYPLEAIGKFFEMPNKEAWLNKIEPSLAFVFGGSGIGLFICLVGVVTLTYFLFRRR